MGDTQGQAGTVTVMTPVRRDALQELFVVLDELQHDSAILEALGNPADPDSGRTHFARLVVLKDLPDEPPRYASRPLEACQLFFTASFDGPLASYYGDLLHSMNMGSRAWAQDVWGCCDGFPGVDSSAAFAMYLASHRVPTTKFVAAYGNSTVRQVRQALRTQQLLRDFARDRQGLEPEQLLSDFQAEFAP